MNNKILTIAALAAVLVAGVFATTPMAAYADGDYDGDSSETNTEQSIKQKNSGGDGSTNVNCARNDISGVTEDGLIPLRPPFDVQLCGTAAVDLGDLFD
jgi:hypothetical protein